MPDTNPQPPGGATPLYTADCGQVLVIEYHGEHPHSVVTTQGEFDFAYSRAHDCVYFHESGGGPTPQRHHLNGYVQPDPPPCALWTDPTVTLLTSVRGTEDPATWTTMVCSWEHAKALGYARLPTHRGDPFEDAREGEVSWCTVCDDWIPEDALCEHLFDSDEGVAGPGKAERSNAVYRDIVLAVVRRAGCARTLRRVLRAKGSLGEGFASLAQRVRDVDDEFPGRYHDGAGWIRCLGPDTPAANAETAGWLDALVAEQDARRASGEACYAVSDGFTRTRRMPWTEARAIYRARGGPAPDYAPRRPRLVRLLPSAPRPPDAPGGG